MMMFLHPSIASHVERNKRALSIANEEPASGSWLHLNFMAFSIVWNGVWLCNSSTSTILLAEEFMSSDQFFLFFFHSSVLWKLCCNCPINLLQVNYSTVFYCFSLSPEWTKCIPSPSSFDDIVLWSRRNGTWRLVPVVVMHGLCHRERCDARNRKFR